MLGLQDKIGKNIGEFLSHNFSDFYPNMIYYLIPGWKLEKFVEIPLRY